MSAHVRTARATLFREGRLACNDGGVDGERDRGARFGRGSATACRAALLLLLSVGGASTAAAQALRDFCADRPGLGTPACTIDPGHVAVEIGVADLTHDAQAGAQSDSLVLGDLLVRYGLTDRVEAQIGWQALGLVRTRAAAGGVEHLSGTGDVRLALRGNLLNPDGSGLSIALMPQLTLPTGGEAIGERDWSAALLLPVSYELGDGIQMAFTGEIDHVSDAEGDGHHLAYGAVFGLEAPLGEALSAAVELAASRDEEPGEHATELLGGLSLAWSPSDSLQLDAGTSIGLNNAAADLEVYFGVARRF